MIQALGWALIHFLWQGAAIALLLAIALRLLRRASANARYLTACAALLLMLAVPVATYLSLEQPAAPAAPASIFAAMPANWSPSVAPSSVPPAPSPAPLPWPLWVVAAWAIGVALLSFRLAGGLLVAHRLKAWATPITSRDWRGRLDRLADRMGLDAYVSFFESALAEVPMAVGWLEPMILVPAAALAQLTPEQMEAILAHELAHIRRLDYPINLLQTAVETLLYYHPAVWWVGRRIREERENCCDDLAVAVCGDAVSYARALVELETSVRRAPQMAMAANGGSLLGRVRRLLAARPGARRNPGAGLAAILILCTAVTAWACVVPMLHAADRNAGRGTGAGHGLGIAAAGTGAGHGAATVAIQSAAIRAAAAVTSRVTVRVDAAAPVMGAQSSTAAQAAKTETQAEHGKSYVQAIADAGYPHLSVDDLIAFKIQGITPDYIRGIRDAGFQPEPRKLISMRVMGVTPEYARRMKQAFPDITVNDLIACRVQGVDPAIAAQLNNIGFGKLTARQIITARIFHLDAAAVESLKKDGFTDLTFNQAITARVQNLTPEYVSALKSAGFPNLTFDEALRAKIMGLTPEFVREARQHGFNNLTIEKLIELQRLGVLSPQ